MIHNCLDFVSTDILHTRYITTCIITVPIFSRQRPTAGTVRTFGDSQAGWCRTAFFVCACAPEVRQIGLKPVRGKPRNSLAYIHAHAPSQVKAPTHSRKQQHPCERKHPRRRPPKNAQATARTHYRKQKAHALSQTTLPTQAQAHTQSDSTYANASTHAGGAPR